MRRDDATSHELEEELHFHVEGVAAELMAAGWTEADARAEAERRFGDVARIREELESIAWDRERRTRRTQMLDTLKQDLRVALRTLRRNPTFAAMAVLTLGLAIGATTAIFSAVDGVLLRPLALKDPDRLVMIWETNPSRGQEEEPPSPPNFLDWRPSTHSFSGMTAFSHGGMTLTEVETPQVLSATSVTANFFDVLGIPVLLGRGFLAGEDEAGGAGVVVLGHGAWERLYASDRSVIGRTLVLDGSPFEVVGVATPGLMASWSEVDIWRPVDFSHIGRRTRMLNVIGRLAPGVTIAQAQQELDGIAARLAQMYPEENTGYSTRLVPMHEQIVRDAKSILLAVLGAVGFVLLLACANVANLALGRAVAREPEMSVRASLGAGRARLTAQLLTESVVLALAGGLVGIVIAWVVVRAFVGFAPGILPRVDEIAVDGRVLGFAVAISILTGLLFGLAPSLRAAGTVAASVLRESGRSAVGGRRSELVRRTLIVTQVGLALLLLVGAGLTLRSMRMLLQVDPGYVTENVVTARVSLSGERYRGNLTKARYFEELISRMVSLPGVRAVGVTSTLPLTPDGIDFDLAYHAEGQPEVGLENAMEVDYRIISPGYLEAMGIPLLAGRDITWFDRIEREAHLRGDKSGGPGGHKVLLVNETFAWQHWPGEDPIGKHVRLYYVREDSWEVVGLVGDTRHAGLSSEPRPQVFVPMAQAEILFGYATLVVRADRAAAAGLAPRMRETAVALDPAEPLFQVERIEALRARSVARDQMVALVFSAFAILAIALSAAGIYGVIAYQVARRTREIGVRMALGAGQARVIWQVVAEAAGMALMGVVLGLIAALSVTRFAGSLLYGVAPWDPLTFASVSLLLMVIALAAALVPALRAARIHPAHALGAQ